jgi:uncharacterized protein (DUF1330 family)
MTPQQIYMRALERLRRRIAAMERNLNGASLSVHEEFEELCLIIPLLEQHILSLSHDPCAQVGSSLAPLDGSLQAQPHPLYQTLANQAIYAIISVEVYDSEDFSAFIQYNWDGIEQYGGRLLVARSPYEVLKGAWCPNRIVIQRWPNVDSFHHWYRQHYQARLDNYTPTISSLFLVEAVETEVAYS